MFISYYAAVFCWKICFRYVVQKTFYSCYFPPIFYGFNCSNHFYIVFSKYCRILLLSLRGYSWFFCFSLFLKWSSTYCVKLCSLFIVLIVINWLAIELSLWVNIFMLYKNMQKFISWLIFRTLQNLCEYLNEVLWYI